MTTRNNPNGQKKALKAVCRAYQYQKNYRKVKKATSKKYYRKKEAEWLMTANYTWVIIKNKQSVLRISKNNVISN